MDKEFLNRRASLLRIAASSMGIALTGRLGAVLAQGQAPAIVTRDAMRPQVPHGVMSGDVSADGAIVWSRADRPARLIVDYALDEAMRDSRRVGKSVV